MGGGRAHPHALAIFQRDSPSIVFCNSRTLPGQGYFFECVFHGDVKAQDVFLFFAAKERRICGQ